MKKIKPTIKKYAVVNQGTRKIYKKSWRRHLSSIERDIHGAQNIACKIMKKLNKKEKDDLQLNITSKESWITYFKNFFADSDEEDMIRERYNDVCDFDNIQLEEIETITKECKSEKTPGTDNLNTELYSCDPPYLKLRFYQFMNCIPEEWRTAIVMPIFGKGNRA
jgi:hypothetical protein